MSSLLKEVTGRAAASMLAIACAAWLGATAALAQPARNLPAPGDEAKLYAAAKGEGKLVLYTGFPLDAMRGVVGEFERKYPGVRVEVLRIVGVAQYQRFVQETEAGQHIADNLMLSDRPSIDDLHRRGFLAEWRVPTYDQFDPQYRLGTHAYSPFRAANAVAYNANKVSQEEADLLARDWKAILDPRFKGRVAVVDQKCATCYTPLHMFLDPALQGRYGRAFLEQVAAMKPAVYPDVTMAVDRVIAGEVDIAYWVAESNPYAAWASGAPIRWVYPSPTPAAPVTWMAVSTNAPHPNAARLFLSWEMSVDGARAFQSKAGSNVAFKGVSDDRQFAKQPWYRPIRELYDIDYARWERSFDADLKLWHDVLQRAR